MSTADIWAGPTTNVPIVNTNGNIYEEVQVATAGQTVFNLLTFQYTVNTKSIFVFKNGDMLRRAVDYTETDSDTVTLAAGALIGDKLSFIAFAIAMVTPPATLNGMPAGGTNGQIIIKNSGSDYDATWQNPSSLVALLDAPRVDVASASTIDLSAIAATTRNIRITGAVQIDGFTVVNGELWAVKFNSSLVLKNNANIACPNAADIKVSANDSCLIRATAANTVEILSYSRASTGNNNPNFQQFRIGVVSGVPVPTANVAAAPTIYMTPYGGNKISLYDGKAWQLIESAEISLALGGLTVNRPYDVFAYYNAGVAALELLSWTSDIVRATAITTQDGVPVKNGDATRKYLGTIYATGVALTADTETSRYVWNYYNRVLRNGHVADVTANWAYSLAAYRQANANAANQFNFVLGVQEDYLNASLKSTMANNTAGVEALSAIGFDGVAGPAAGNIIGDVMVPVANYKISLPSSYNTQPAIGRHYVSWLESLATATGVGTWQGGVQSGMEVQWKA